MDPLGPCWYVWECVAAPGLLRLEEVPRDRSYVLWDVWHTLQSKPQTLW